jgi:CheY-like chemotaxis protein
VLVVEDDPQLRHVATRLIKQLGYEVYQAENGDSALALLGNAELSVDLLFSDVVMPGNLDGFSLARAVRKLRPQLPILLASGYPDPRRAGLADSPFIEGVALLKKPYQKQQLAQTIHDLVTRPPGNERPELGPGG